ncbi:ribokinase [Vibrio zhugei]|uniref:Ribokinase n=1 Tax=Vibrio zhugei TaxID=2479546 RepID=A0ABV7CAK7_9VIBR|nr:ribokinase [Vibrio zhugei]
MSQLVVLGSVNADHVLQVPRFPRPGETLQGHQYQVIAGGKGANQAVAAARLDSDITFIASLGDDTFGQSMCQRFADDGMDVSHIEVQENCPTGIAMIQVSQEGENTICLSEEANAYLTESVVATHRQVIEQAEYLLMQLETPLDGITYAAHVAKQHGTHVVLNPAPAQPLSDELLACIDMITPNETEAEVLTGIEVTDEASADRAAQALHEKGIGTVMITLGAKGVWVSVDGKGKTIAGFAVDACDSTAAGDTFNGALVTGLIEKMSLESAVRFAHGAAAISVTRFGAQTSIPTRREVMEFLQQQ